jgi:hypothetical protein
MGIATARSQPRGGFGRSEKDLRSVLRSYFSHCRNSSLRLASQKMLKLEGVITVGDVSQICDGASLKA